MSNDSAGFMRGCKGSRRSLVTKVGQFAYWTVVAVIFAWAAWLRFRLPLDPIADPDISWYLFPALTKLTGGGFSHTPYGWNFVYPGFVYLLLRTFGDFRAITIAQHFFGLITGGILLLTWWRASVFAPNSRSQPVAYHVLGLLATGTFLLAGEPIHFEMLLRQDGICAFLVGINIYLVIEFIACSFIEDRRTAAVVYGIAAVFVSFMLRDVRPSFSLVAVVSLVPIGVFFFRSGWLRQKVALGAGAALSALLLLLPEQFLSRHDEVSKRYLPTMLFILHADLIRDQMADDLEHNAKLPYSRERLSRIHTALSAAIAKASILSRPRKFSFDYDYLMNRSAIRAQLRSELGGDASALTRFYWFYYRRTWRQHPLLMIKKIGRQMAIFYGPKCPAYRSWKSLSLANDYRQSVVSLSSEASRKIWTAYSPAVDFMSRTELLARGAPVVQQPAYVRRLLAILAATYRPLLLIAVTLSAAVLLQKWYRRGLGWLAALVLFVYSYNLTSCLVVAVVQSLDNSRKLAVQMYFTLLAQFFAFWFLLEFALEMRARARNVQLD
jgi:hypothetical protein